LCEARFAGLNQIIDGLPDINPVYFFVIMAEAITDEGAVTLTAEHQLFMGARPEIIYMGGLAITDET